MLKFNLQLVIPTKAKEYFLVTIAAKLICRKSLIRLGIVRNIKSTIKNRLLYGKMADGILVNNDAIKDTLSQSKFINQNKIHVIYNGVESVENIPSFEKDPNPFIFIYIGSLINRKNVSKLVQIFHKLVKQENNKLTELWLVGDGPERTTLEKLCKKLEIENQVRFMGHQTNVLSFLGSAHAMVLLSENEGFPNAALESMANGVPVILVQTAETANVIENNYSGLLVNLNEEGEILNAMTLLLHNHKKRLQLRLVALEKIKSQFSISAMTEKTDQLIRKMINV
jgi:glycosyltransferase involved in cell wall biosynthesis